MPGGPLAPPEEPGRTVEALPAGIGDGRPYDPAWCLPVSTGRDDPLARVAESLLSLADGVIGTRGVLEEAQGTPADPPVLAAGVYEPAPVVGERLVGLPAWCSLPLVAELEPGERVLDLRDGVLTRTVPGPAGPLRTARFACAARPGVGVLVAEASPAALDADAVLVAEAGPAVLDADAATGRALAGVRSGSFSSALGGGVALAVATEVRRRSSPPALLIERIAAHASAPDHRPRPSSAGRRLTAGRAAGVADLLAEQRAAWRRRWEDADVEVVGDPEATLAVRFALFNLFSCARRSGSAPVGARGLSGSAYAGHVFWDTEAFVLPVLAAVDRHAARAILEYRLRRLPAARARARRDGRRGVRFPWESAASGDDVTPTSGIDPHGDPVPIHTGELEEHITADVAWAAWRYASWGGGWRFLSGPGRPLLVDTARYWASRVRWDSHGRAHVDEVTGPDEYHERVDDNAFTNVMARWNLRRAAELVERGGAATLQGRAGLGGSAGLGGKAARLEAAAELEEAAEWRHVADGLVDNAEPATGRHEQFAGYDRLEPLLATDVGSPPVAADLVLGHERLARTQIVKQADVLMAHFLVPEALPAGSFSADLEHYLPRTAHGSSLSPAVHATLLARAGRSAEALAMFRLAAAIDLDDLTETTAGGLHFANLGGLWQAVVHGFAGVTVGGPGERALGIDPVLPEEWSELRFRLRWHGRRLRFACRPDRVHVSCDRPVSVRWRGQTRHVRPPGGWVT